MRGFGILGAFLKFKYTQNMILGFQSHTQYQMLVTDLFSNSDKFESQTLELSSKVDRL